MMLDGEYCSAPHFPGTRCASCFSRPDWDEYFVGVAYAVAERADCTRRQVGAVLVKDHRIVSTGYNGGASGGPSCLAGDCPRGLLSYTEAAADSSYRNCVAVHAEVNALLQSDFSDRAGGTLYCTHKPCPDCAKILSNSGLAAVVYPVGEVGSVVREEL